MSKIRQALKYEHLLTEAAVRHERELREAEKTAYNHERELRYVFDQHERELREKSEGAVEKAHDTQLKEYERRLEGMNEFREQLQRQASNFMTIDQFEREHRELSSRIDLELRNLETKIIREEKVTIRQEASQQVLDKLSANNRWLIGLAAGVLLTLGTTLLHLLKVI